MHAHNVSPLPTPLTHDHIVIINKFAQVRAKPVSGTVAPAKTCRKCGTR